MHVPRPSNCVMKTLAWALASPPEGSLAASETSGPADTLLFVQIQLMCGAARIILLSVNASSDDPNQLNVF
jgi:hypothetical protein